MICLPTPTRLLLALALMVPGAFGAFPTLELKPVVLGQVHSPTNIVSANDRAT